MGKEKKLRCTDLLGPQAANCSPRAQEPRARIKSLPTHHHRHSHQRSLEAPGSSQHAGLREARALRSPPSASTASVILYEVRARRVRYAEQGRHPLTAQPTSSASAFVCRSASCADHVHRTCCTRGCRRIVHFFYNAQRLPARHGLSIGIHIST